MDKRLIYPSLPQGKVYKVHGRMEMIKRISKFLARIKDILLYFPSFLMQMMGEAMIQYIEQKPDRVNRYVSKKEDGVE